MLGDAILPRGIAERPAAATDLLQSCLGSAQYWQEAMRQESSGCCVGAWGKNRHFCRKIYCPTPARLCCPLCVLGKGKALASKAVKGGNELIFPCKGVKAGAGLRPCFSKCNSFVCASPGKSLTGDTLVLTCLIKH